MKKISIITIVVMLFMAFCFSSCRKDNNNFSGSGSGSSSYNSNSGSGNNGGYNGGSSGNSGGYNGGSSGGSNTDATPSAPTGVKVEDCGPRMYPYALLSWNLDWSVDRWDVYRSSSSHGIFTKKGSNISNSWADESVSCGNTYYYKVKAVKGSKESDFSSVVSVYIRN